MEITEREILQTSLLHLNFLNFIHVNSTSVSYAEPNLTELTDRILLSRLLYFYLFRKLNAGSIPEEKFSDGSPPSRLADHHCDGFLTIADHLRSKHRYNWPVTFGYSRKLNFYLIFTIKHSNRGAGKKKTRRCREFSAKKKVRSNLVGCAHRGKDLRMLLH